ncbi:unnamed protein product [Mytilus coruscus]|uniref:Uncharacterized protein n=1 Tax=Mytilus coruscus TaxID=42192 RepID=A0A6J8EVY8_MYTCO|nr:unnamed protein product [Mytilus coruscus]
MDGLQGPLLFKNYASEIGPSIGSPVDPLDGLQDPLLFKDYASEIGPSIGSPVGVLQDPLDGLQDLLLFKNYASEIGPSIGSPVGVLQDLLDGLQDPLLFKNYASEIGPSIGSPVGVLQDPLDGLQDPLDGLQDPLLSEDYISTIRRSIGSPVKDHPIPVKEKVMVQTSKKKNCPASIIMKEVICFPDFKVTENTEKRKRVVSEKIRDLINGDDEIKMEYRIYMKFPTDQDHQNTHQLGEVYSKIDQKNMLQLVAEWQQQNPADNFDFMPAAEIHSGENGVCLENIEDIEQDDSDEFDVHVKHKLKEVIEMTELQGSARRLGFTHRHYLTVKDSINNSKLQATLDKMGCCRPPKGSYRTPYIHDKQTTGEPIEVAQVTEDLNTSKIIKTREAIIAITGRQPKDASHIEDVKYMIETFPHPNLDGEVNQQDAGGTVPVNCDIFRKLTDWSRLSKEQQRETKTFLLMMFSVEDLQLAWDEYILQKRELPNSVQYRIFINNWRGNKTKRRTQSIAFANDIKLRSHGIMKSLFMKYNGDRQKISKCLPGIVWSVVNCYSGNAVIRVDGAQHYVMVVKNKLGWYKSINLNSHGLQNGSLIPTDRDKILIESLLEMKLSQNALDQMNYFSNTNKCESINRTMSTYLHKNKNFSCNAIGRASEAGLTVNNNRDVALVKTLKAVGCTMADMMRALEHKDDELFQKRNEQQHLHSELDFVKHINEGQFRHLRNFRLENATLRDNIRQFENTTISDLIEQNHDKCKTIDKLAEQNGSLTNAIELEVHISQTKEQIIAEQSQLIEEQKKIIEEQKQKLRKYKMNDEESRKQFAEQGRIDVFDQLKHGYK